MRIVIIEAGSVGSALARGCVAAGHTVVLSAQSSPPRQSAPPPARDSGWSR
jgi:predicted dinucleotide-binding enzyme